MTKKIVSLFLILTLVLSAVAFAASAPVNSSYAVDLDFNDYETTDDNAKILERLNADSSAGAKANHKIDEKYTATIGAREDDATDKYLNLKSNSAYINSIIGLEKAVTGVALIEYDNRIPKRGADYGVGIRTANAYGGSGVFTQLFRINSVNIVVGNDTYSGAGYDHMFPYGGWNHVKIYVQLSTGKIRVDVTGKLGSQNFSKSYYGSATPYPTIVGFDFYAQNTNYDMQFDNIKVSSVELNDGGFFEVKENYSFDDDFTLLNLADPGYDAAKHAYQGFTQNSKLTTNSGPVYSAGSAEIDGRKVLKVHTNSAGNLTADIYKTFNTPGYPNIDVDFRVDKGKLDYQVNGYTEAAPTTQVKWKSVFNVATASNGVQTIKVADGTTFAHQPQSGDWLRISMQFQTTGGEPTYSISLINLTQGVKEEKTVVTPGAVVNIYGMYFSTGSWANECLYYVDNLRFGPKNTLSAINPSTDKYIFPSDGVSILTNNNIDPTRGSVTVNGEAASLSADTPFEAKIDSFPADDTAYTVAYTLYDVYGQELTGTFNVTTGKDYYFTALNGDTADNKYTVTATGKIAKNRKAMLMATVYEEGSSRLTSVDFKYISDSAQITDFSVEANIPDNGKTYETKAFLWSDKMEAVEIISQ